MLKMHLIEAIEAVLGISLGNYAPLLDKLRRVN